MTIPSIDFMALAGGDKPMRARLVEAVSETGFCKIENTPIARADIEDIIAHYRWFFLQSRSLKTKLDMAKTGSNRGWGRSGGEQVNPGANPDYKEVFDLGVELSRGHELAEMRYYAPNLWPDAAGGFGAEAEAFKKALTRYYMRACDLALELLALIAQAAKLPGAFFADKFDPPMALLRANYYPPRPGDAGAKDFGIAAHTDYGCLTLLASDGAPGLEVKLKTGSWEAVNFEPGEFVINFGEMLESWSKGAIRATEHRVIGSAHERISVPLFFNPRFDTNVAPLGSGETLLAGDYLARRYDETYLHRREAAG